MTFVTERVPSRVYRVTRFADALTFTAWEFISASTPGRWDDPRGQYRVLYAADKPVAALVEVLQDLRRRPEAERIVHDVVDDASIDSPFDVFPPDTLMVVFDRLRDRRIAELLRREDSADCVVKVTEPGSRTRLEQELGADRLAASGIQCGLKVGDLIGSDCDITRAVSRIVYDADGGMHVGIAAESAELPSASCYALFETTGNSGRTRAALAAGTSHLALDSAVISSLLEALWRLFPDEFSAPQPKQMQT